MIKQKSFEGLKLSLIDVKYNLMLIGFHAELSCPSSAAHPHILYKPMNKFSHYQKL